MLETCQCQVKLARLGCTISIHKTMVSVSFIITLLSICSFRLYILLFLYLFLRWSSIKHSRYGLAISSGKLPLHWNGICTFAWAATLSGGSMHFSQTTREAVKFWRNKTFNIAVVHFSLFCLYLPLFALLDKCRNHPLLL